MWHSLISLVAAASLLAACSTASAPVAGKQSDAASPVSCMPHGAPAVAELNEVWEHVRARVIAIEDEQSNPYPVVLMRWKHADGRQVQMGFTDKGPIYFDADPENDKSPYMANKQLVRDDGKIRNEPSGECRWEPQQSQAAGPTT